MKQIFMHLSRAKSLKFLLLFLVCTGQTVLAQNPPIKLNLPPGNLSQAIEVLKKKTDYQFFYEDKLGKTAIGEMVISANSINQVLDKVLSGTGITYKIDKKVIYLTKQVTTPIQPTTTPAKKRISGNVVSASTSEALIGVTVAVTTPSGKYGTTTNMDGNFTLDVNPNDVLEFSYIGFLPQTKAVGTQNTFSITLQEDAKIIKEVVVTALGIKRDKKMLGYAIQDVKAETLNKTGDPTITGALQGKVAGLQMNTSSTGLSGSTKITLRGNSSLTDNNQPLWVVDGVPFNDNNDSGASLYGGVDRGGASVDINPEDIESISVLKGPNAAALYGSRAGNGVIVITTKKGTKSNGFGVTYNGSLTWSNVASTLNMQDKYGQGENGLYNKDSFYSFGGLLDGHEYTGWNGNTVKYQKYGDKLKDFFGTGFSQTHNVSIGNVTEKSNYRMSVGNTNTTGIFDKEKLNKTNLDLKAGMDMNKYLSLDTKISLSNTKADNRPVFGKSGEVYQLLFIPNNIDLEDLKTFRDNNQRHIYYVNPKPDVQNPYYINYRFSNSDERWRAFGYYSMKINFTSWLYGTAKYAFDYYHTDIEEIDRTNGIDPQANESIHSRENNYFEQNMEAMLFGNNNIGEKIRIGYSVGVNEMYQKTHFLLGKSQHMRKPEYWYHNSAQGFNAAENGLTKRKTRSVFATAQLAWDEYLALDFTARNDWSSTLPIDNSSYFYPSANLSFVFSDFIKSQKWNLPDWMTFGKVRLSAAQVGKDTDPYQLKTLENWTQTPAGPVFSLPKARANAELKPEISSSMEAGLDMKFFNNRFGFDFTYYRSLTTNQIMMVPDAPSSGYSWKWINAGKIENKGFELMLYATPVKVKDFEFNLNVNLAHNNSVVNKLDEKAKYMSFNFRNDNLLVDVGAHEGGRLGDIFGLRGYKRDDNGNIITRNGLPLLENVEPTQRKAIGNIQPDLLMSVSPSFTFKNVSFSALFDMKFGGNVVSMSESVATGFGTAKRTEDREKNIVVNGIDETTKKTNTVEVPAQEYYKTLGGENGIAEAFLYNASFIKLKEVSLSYSLSKSLLKSTPFSNVRLSLVGRNLAYLLKHTPGTSPEGGFDTTMYSQAIDFTSVPYTRTLGVALSVSF